MEITVKSKYLKASPQKVRPILWNLRGQNPSEALAKVSFIYKKGAQFATDILKSALAAAKENDLENEKLVIKSIYCSEGPKLKRRQIKARGRSDAILKRMCHLTLTISDELFAKEDQKMTKKIKENTPITETNKEKI